MVSERGITLRLKLGIMDKKLKVKVSLRDTERWDEYFDLSGTIPQVIERLQEIMTENSTLFDFEIEVEAESGYEGSCSLRIQIWAFRWETDEEQKNRITETERKAQEKILENNRKAQQTILREKAIYEQLKSKYGG